MRNLLLISLLLPALAMANATIPTEDLKGTEDLLYLKRYEGSFIVDRGQQAFEEFVLPTSKLEKTDKIDSHNNHVYLPPQKVDVEGKLTRLIYVAPADRTPLEVIRNYQEELTGKGGSVLFECKDEECGGNFTYGADSGGNDTGMVQLVYPDAQMMQPDFTNGNCALNSWHANQRYASMKLTTEDKTDVHLALLVYTLKDDLYCKALNGRTIVVLAAAESKAREQRMVTVVPAEDMGKGIGTDGHIALYGIYFDYDKADLKPDSKPQLEEIAKMLQADTALNVVVAGHTDNQGEIAYNLDLSKRRAESVVQALGKDYGVDAKRLTAQGVGMAAPVASNDAEEGRAKNRRVEIVKR
ncbi:MAG: OmpA family protein [Thiothrix sp.]|uniref:OmpA family protein n=1 Tax=Thiothrix sp. TaxID=1032 RepID=UPI0026024279|nr:OmpA family protein [Thiothrix sp.]MDD5394576.1 OmpA family protein [Thiothrix sp.]